MSTIEQGLDEESTVAGGSTVEPHQELIGEFARRFPLFNHVVGRFGEDAPSERLPWFFGFILAAATKPGIGACCFVLDKTPGTTVIAAVLSGLGRLQLDFPDLVESYAKNALTRGQRVKVRPSNFVYEYEGVWEEHPHLFKLKLLGEDAWRSFPRNDVLRLEPTDRVQPKGTGADLGAFERSPLDRLLDLTTCGNNSVIHNVMLVQIPRAHLTRIVDVTTLAPNGAEQFAPLSGFLPWGSIGQDGTLKPNDAFQVVGEPLIAATSVPEDLALACCRADAGTKTVLVDGARRLARDLQAFDDIAERQRLVVLASPDESEDIELLKDRGCPVWCMSPGDVLIGEACPGRRTRASLAGATVRAADVRRRCRVDTVECCDDALQAAATSLERVAEMIADREELPEVEEALARLFGVLFEFSECCFGVGAGAMGDLQNARERDGTAGELAGAHGHHRTSQSRRCLGARGHHRLRRAEGGRVVEHSLRPRWAVGGGSKVAADRGEASGDLRALGADLPVVPISTVGTDDEFDGIIVLAWPNERRFTRLKNLSVAPDIRVLAYPFESKWVLRHEARERARSRSNRVDAEELSSFLGIAARLLSPLNGAQGDVEDRPGKEIALDLPVFRLEDRIGGRQRTRPRPAASGEESRQAQLVQFFGGCYALLTEWSELPVLNDLVDGAKGGNAKLNSEAASSLSTGDFVLFRAGGDKEFIRLIAEEILGSEDYLRTREVAERWKSTLRRLGQGAATIQRRLAGNGLERTPQTIAGWLGNPDRIGPGDYDDIEAIARTAGDTELLSAKDDVRDAISRIRGAHQAAGMRLTGLILGELRGRIHGLDDQPTLLDLDYGHAWVVQVASVEARRQAYPANQVNRLIGATESAF